MERPYLKQTNVTEFTYQCLTSTLFKKKKKVLSTNIERGDVLLGHKIRLHLSHGWEQKSLLGKVESTMLSQLCGTVLKYLRHEQHERLF